MSQNKTARKLKMPSIRAVSAELVSIKTLLDCDVTEIDVRLQVHESGHWLVHWGDAQYDTDHRGHWGASTISRTSNCRDVASELINEASDSFAMFAD